MSWKVESMFSQNRKWPILYIFIIRGFKNDPFITFIALEVPKRPFQYICIIKGSKNDPFSTFVSFEVPQKTFQYICIIWGSKKKHLPVHLYHNRFQTNFIQCQPLIWVYYIFSFKYFFYRNCFDMSTKDNVMHIRDTETTEGQTECNSVRNYIIRNIFSLVEWKSTGLTREGELTTKDDSKTSCLWILIHYRTVALNLVTWLQCR